MMKTEQVILLATVGLLAFGPARGPRRRREVSRMRYPYPPPRIARGRGRRNNRTDYVRPMAERWSQRGGLRGLIEWLNVENSLRWLPRQRAPGPNGEDMGRATYCDHYFLDFFCEYYGEGVVPNPAGLWWSSSAEAALRRGEAVAEDVTGSDRTLYEKAAAGTNGWLRTQGPSFGWRRFNSAEELRAWCNATGRPGVISTPSHVAVALPDAVSPSTPGDHILLSQAGGRNRRYDRGNSWYRNNADVFYGGWSPSGT